MAAWTGNESICARTVVVERFKETMQVGLRCVGRPGTNEGGEGEADGQLDAKKATSRPQAIHLPSATQQHDTQHSRDRTYRTSFIVAGKEREGERKGNGRRERVGGEVNRPPSLAPRPPRQTRFAADHRVYDFFDQLPKTGRASMRPEDVGAACFHKKIVPRENRTKNEKGTESESGPRGAGPKTSETDPKTD